MKLSLLILLGYLIGSIPSGYIAGKIKGIDVTKEGFRKIGTSNIYRTLGFLPAVLVFFCDFMKSIIPIFITGSLGFSEPLASLSGFAAICGHNWPIWVGFKGGGRGAATSWGVLYYFMPCETIILFVVFAGLSGIKKSSPLPMLIFFLLMPFGTRVFHEPLWMTGLTLGVFALLLFTRVIGGIKAIRATEYKTKTILNLILFDRESRNNK
ncbi:MAG: glycerol-3-phosphate acyltransferase [candidate division WOR-3 bacterium]|nr:glycerol-3-phosphate acyltransferase [candidate division WOR-3 bacterium]